jgi:hypothetical protein
VAQTLFAPVSRDPLRLTELPQGACARAGLRSSAGHRLNLSFAFRSVGPYTRYNLSQLTKHFVVLMADPSPLFGFIVLAEAEMAAPSCWHRDRLVVDGLTGFENAQTDRPRTSGGRLHRLPHTVPDLPVLTFSPKRETLQTPGHCLGVLFTPHAAAGWTFWGWSRFHTEV